MREWEYNTIFIEWRDGRWVVTSSNDYRSTPRLYEILDQIGKHGWEMTSMFPNDDTWRSYIAVFKRPL